MNEERSTNVKPERKTDIPNVDAINTSSKDLAKLTTQNTIPGEINRPDMPAENIPEHPIELSEQLEPIANLIDTLVRSGKKYDLKKIEQAFLYANEMHAGQFRTRSRSPRSSRASGLIPIRSARHCCMTRLRIARIRQI